MTSRARHRLVAGAILILFVVGLGVFLAPFAFPTPPPIVTQFRATRLFSPNGDRTRERARVGIRLNTPSNVTVQVVDGDRVVRTLLDDKRRPTGWVRLAWDGGSDAGGTTPDGSYVVRLRARAGQKRWNASRRITVDRSAPGIGTLAVSEADAAGPASWECRVGVTATDKGTASITAMGGSPRPVASFGPVTLGDGRTALWSWDGRDSGGQGVAPGLYSLGATLTDSAGNRSARETTCWVGHLLGRPVPARPVAGGFVGVRLVRPDGTAVPAGAAVQLTLFRRVGTPGRGTGAVLGRRIGAQVRGPAGSVTVPLPRRLRPSALWLVASTSGGRALIALPR